MSLNKKRSLIVAAINSIKWILPTLLVVSCLTLSACGVLAANIGVDSHSPSQQTASNTFTSSPPAQEAASPASPAQEAAQEAQKTAPPAQEAAPPASPAQEALEPAPPALEPASPLVDTSIYQYRSIHSPDGIGKFYLGREIAKVMGHTEALWLERPSREREEQPNQIVNALNLKPTDTVADIGAGTGYFSFRMAQKLPQGKVLAVDIQPEMLDMIEFLKQENHITNVKTILGTVSDPNLPSESERSRTVDLALMVDAYHEFSHPYEMMQGLVKGLKLGGRAVLVEYRKENPFIPIKALHKMTQQQVRKEMQAVGLQWRETKSFLPTQHLMVFEKVK